MPVVLRTLNDVSLDDFVTATDDPPRWHDRVSRDLRLGLVRPEWCWVAVDANGSVLARHYWWARNADGEPYGVDLVSNEHPATSVRLLAHARDVLGVSGALSLVTSPIEAVEHPGSGRPDVLAVLRASGFGLAVSRVTVERVAATVAPRGPGRLTLRPARVLSDQLLLELFQSVGDGSLDHGMIERRSEAGPVEEARLRLAEVRIYPGDPDWFSVGFDPRGEAVGYVVPGLAGDAPMIGELGVALAHRGHGYARELLSWGTTQLFASGATRIVADTDRANTPMRAVFRRAGYREFRWRDDYRWRRAG